MLTFYLIGCIVGYVYLLHVVCLSLNKMCGHTYIVAFSIYCLPIALLSWVLVLFLLIFYKQSEEGWKNISRRW